MNFPVHDTPYQRLPRLSHDAQLGHMHNVDRDRLAARQTEINARADVLESQLERLHERLGDRDAVGMPLYPRHEALTPSEIRHLSDNLEAHISDHARFLEEVYSRIPRDARNNVLQRTGTLLLPEVDPGQRALWRPAAERLNLHVSQLHDNLARSVLRVGAVSPDGYNVRAQEATKAIDYLSERLDTTLVKLDTSISGERYAEAARQRRILERLKTAEPTGNEFRIGPAPRGKVAEGQPPEGTLLTPADGADGSALNIVAAQNDAAPENKISKAAVACIVGGGVLATGLVGVLLYEYLNQRQGAQTAMRSPYGQIAGTQQMRMQPSSSNQPYGASSGYGTMPAPGYGPPQMPDVPGALAYA